MAVSFSLDIEILCYSNSVCPEFESIFRSIKRLWTQADLNSALNALSADGIFFWNQNFDAPPTFDLNLKKIE
jgi:hypothetical protein